MAHLPRTISAIKKLLDDGTELPLATKNYPSRGQTAVQKLYQTKKGKLFLKRSSEQNHIDCRIDPKVGSIAEREFWAFRLACAIGLRVPELALLDDRTTVQVWLDIPDGHLYKMSQGIMAFSAENIFNCALFDWLTGQVDRHDANYLYDYVNREVVPVDSAYAFLKYEGSLPDYLHLFEVGDAVEVPKNRSTGLQKRLRSMTDDQLRNLVPLRDESEAGALLTRKRDLDDVRSIQDIITLFRRSAR
jgi:hypothetical protein